LQVRRADYWVGAFIALFLAPNLAALVVPYEEFPYTSAPMFAHYASANTPRYHLRFVAEVDGADREVIAPSMLGAPGTPLARLFFGHVYGSIEPSSPFGVRGPDTPAAFEARLSRFFGAVVTVLERRDPTWQRPTHIRLDAVRLTPDNRDETVHTVGYYSVAAGRFTHTWRPAP
jgi:hypothetical protein